MSSPTPIASGSRAAPTPWVNPHAAEFASVMRDPGRVPEWLIERESESALTPAVPGRPWMSLALSALAQYCTGDKTYPDASFQALCSSPVFANTRNIMGNYPIHLVAAAKIDLGLMATLLQAEPRSVSYTNRYADTPAHLAAGWGDLTVFRRLSHAGPENLQKRNGAGQTPAAIAVHHRRPELFAEILTADPSAAHFRNDESETLLHLAIRTGCVPIVAAVTENLPVLCPVAEADGITPLLLSALLLKGEDAAPLRITEGSPTDYKPKDFMYPLWKQARDLKEQETTARKASRDSICTLLARLAPETIEQPDRLGRSPMETLGESSQRPAAIAMRSLIRNRKRDELKEPEVMEEAAKAIREPTPTPDDQLALF